MALRLPSSVFPPSVSTLYPPLAALAIRVDHPLSPNSPVKTHHLRDGMFGYTGRKNADGSQRFHAGVDLVAKIGTRVRAVAPGVVEWILPGVAGYGTCLLHSFRWRDGSLLYVFYAHLSQPLVRQHAHVVAGTVVALTGVSGLPLVRDSQSPHKLHPCSTHPHLHFEIRTSGSKHLANGRISREDPLRFIGPIPFQQDTIDFLLRNSETA
jgi:murein DD-endopeptidase MepM/ murein hydrolase activator NlpD